MMKYTLAQARRDFDVGYLNRWHVERAPMGGGWYVHFGEGNGRGVLVDTRSHEPRAFRSLDSAISAIESTGFEVNAIFQG